MAIVSGAKTIGFSNRPYDVPATLPPPADAPQAVLDELIQRLTNVEILAQGKADANSIRSLIAFSDEDVLISGRNIVLNGAVTFTDIVNEQNGTTSGLVDPLITRIIGDRIQTGSITSNNWGASQGTAIDLDNETITMGGSDSPAFLFDGTDLFVSGTITAGAVISGSVLIDGVAASTVVARANDGEDIHDKLLQGGTAILTGVIQPTNTGALAVGTITWNSTTGALTGGTGIAITEFGIIGASSGSATFTIEASTGDATFAGDVVTSGQVVATGETTSGGISASIVGNPDASSQIAIAGRGDGATGVYGFDVGGGDGIGGLTTNAGGAGVRGTSISSGSVGGHFTNTISGGIALQTGSGSIDLNGPTDISSTLDVSGLATFDSSIEMDSTTANLCVGPASNLGNNNLILDLGAGGGQNAGQIHIYASNTSGGDATWSLDMEQNVAANTTPTPTHRFQVRINGTLYWFYMEAV